MPSAPSIRCELCGGTGRVAISLQRRIRTLDEVASIPKTGARSIPRTYRSPGLDLFTCSKKRERLEKDLRSAHRRIKLAMEQIAEITREIECIQGRIAGDERRRAGADRAAKSLVGAGK